MDPRRFFGSAERDAIAAAAAAAEAAGLVYRFVPVDGRWQTPQQVEDFARLLGELPRPLLLFCRSGARSSRLFAAAQSSIARG